MININIAFSYLPKIGLGVVKEEYKSHINSSTSKERVRLQHIQKTTSVSTATQNIQLRLSTLTPQPWLKNNLCKVSSRLDLEAPCLKSTSASCTLRGTRQGFF